MSEIKTINATAFIIRDEAGKVTDGGFIQFDRLNPSTVKTTIKVLKDEAVTNMVDTIPPGGYCVTDRMSNRIELITAEMDASIPFATVTDAIESLRDYFNVQLSPECKAEADRLIAKKTIAVKPNPVKS